MTALREISAPSVEYCGTSNCTNKLHHIYQQNIDEAQYNGQFESVFGLRFSYSECIVVPSSQEDYECQSDEEKEVVIVDELTDINFNEEGDEIEESDESDESSNNESSDDIDNDNEVTEPVLSVIYEAYFWKSFKESMIKEKEIPIQTIVNMTSYWKGNQQINHRNNIKKTLELVKDNVLQFSQWKYNSIKNVIRGKYKLRNMV